MPNVKMLVSTFSSSHGRLSEGEVYAASEADAKHWIEQGLAEETKDKPKPPEGAAAEQEPKKGTAITREDAAPRTTQDKG
jgi:hypothetical protein